MEKKNRRGRRGPDKIQVFKVQKDMPLFEFLLETFADRSKTTVKSYLAHPRRQNSMLRCMREMK